MGDARMFDVCLGVGPSLKSVRGRVVIEHFKAATSSNTNLLLESGGRHDGCWQAVDWQVPHRMIGFFRSWNRSPYYSSSISIRMDRPSTYKFPIYYKQSLNSNDYLLMDNAAEAEHARRPPYLRYGHCRYPLDLPLLTFRIIESSIV